MNGDKDHNDIWNEINEIKLKQVDHSVKLTWLMRGTSAVVLLALTNLLITVKPI